MNDAPLHGILLVDKTQGWTSHDAVGRLRRLVGTRRVGHAGTLDPLATGLLVLGIGQGTRLLTYLVGLPKTYTATIRLGQATTTDDAEGEALGPVRRAAGIPAERLESALAALRGDIAQVPSTVSAIKVDGRRAYARARAGEDVDLAARPVTIQRLEVLARRDEDVVCDLDVIVECSSGTYVRALARDLGAALEVGGHLTALRRTAVGPFSVDDAIVLPPRGQDADRPALMGLGATAAAVMPVAPVTDEQAQDLGHGKRPVLSNLPARRAAACDARGALVAVIEAIDASDEGRAGTVRPLLVVPADART